MHKILFSFFGLLIATMLATAPMLMAANTHEQNISAKLEGWVTYGPESDGCSLLLLTEEGKYLVVVMGSAEFPELAKLKAGDMLSMRVNVSQDKDDTLGITVPHYSYLSGSGKILSR